MVAEGIAQAFRGGPVDDDVRTHQEHHCLCTLRRAGGEQCSG
jgi:hypothetical protein